ncbi:MAG: hypothetical protein U0S48_10575 [Solirubrobacteraceae bacterium]
MFTEQWARDQRRRQHVRPQARAELRCAQLAGMTVSLGSVVLLTVTTTHRPATDLGYLLLKHPDRVQSFGLPFGEARVFYPEATEARCTAAMLLDITIRSASFSAAAA